MQNLNEQLHYLNYSVYFNIILANYFDSKIISRGKTIHNDRKVEYLEAKDGCHFLKLPAASSRSKSYVVEVSKIKTTRPHFTCTCPYYKNGSVPCKHLAAAFFELGMLLDKRPYKNIHSVTHLTASIFFFPIPNHVRDAIGEFQPEGSYYYRAEPTVSFDHKSPKYVEGNVLDGHRAVFHRVIVEAHEGFLFTTCTCNKTAKGFCSHQVDFFQAIANDAPDFFYSVEWTDDEKKEIATELKFGSFEEASKFYNISPSPRGMNISPKQKGLWMPLTTENASSSLVQFLTPNREKKLSLPRTKPKDLSGLTECILIHSMSDYLVINPVLCRLNEDQTEILSKIDHLWHFHSIPLERAFFPKSTGTMSSEMRTIKLCEMADELNKYPVFLTIENESTQNPTFAPITVSSQKVNLVLEEKRLSDYFTLTFKISIGKDEYDLKSSRIHIYDAFIRKGNEIYTYQSKEVRERVLGKDGNSSIKILYQYEEEFKQTVLPELLSKITLRKPTKSVVAYDALDIKKSIYLSELSGFVLFRPVVTYGKNEYDLLSGTSVLWNNYEEGIKIARDKALEEAFVNLLRSLHPEFEKQQHSEVLYLSPKLMLVDAWFLTFVKEMQQAGVVLYGQKELKSFKYHLSTPKISMSTRSGIDWLDTKIEVSFDKQHVSLSKLKQAIVKGNDFVTLADGRLGLLPEEWIKKLKRYFGLGHVEKDQLRISKLKFNVIDDLLEGNDDEALLQEIEAKKEALRNFNEVGKTPIAKKLKATLRPYQEEGINWLGFLDQFSFGGILADDMGLGKTIQVIAYLGFLKEKKAIGQNLVVAPRSLIYNWQNEVIKFYPNIKTLVHHGLVRPARLQDFKGYDLIITTYGTLMNDVEWLSKKTFNWLVMDESQSIKNYLSKRNKSLRLIQAQHRLALTGTPIENNSFDLYAQMQVLNPYLLGDPSHFKEHYAKPIDQFGSEEASLMLQQITSPFILRRTKQQVATDLPEKTETVLTCEMLPAQRKVYNSFKTKVKEELLGQIETDGIENSQMNILAAMLKLRQLCLSTALPNLDGDYGNSSAKIETLVEQLAEMPKGSKALVFSQFVQMLHLVKDAFDAKGIGYAYLDGKTHKREKEIETFQTQEDCKVFLISLKAGGTGLNLTEADYVFILDPWWNPAVEAQAIDRTYRIGQQKQVFAYKMICKDSIEEKIIELQQRKIKLAKSIVKTDDGFLKKLSKSDIEVLFD